MVVAPGYKRITLSDFGREVLKDLPKLIQEHPTGIYVSHLQEYYGEPQRRCQDVIHYLASQGHTLARYSASRATYLLPKNYEPPVMFLELTPLQRSVVCFIQEQCATSPSGRISTDCSQMARLLNCSIGGLSLALQRTAALGYVKIHQMSGRGRVGEMILSVQPRPSTP